MILREVREILAAEWAWKRNCPECWTRDVSSCRASDLMSDVLSFRGVGSLLLTGLTNSQVIRTVAVADIAAVCFVRGKRPQPDAIRLAEEAGIPLIVTDLMMFEACGRLYAKGLRGESEKEAATHCRKTE